MVVGVFWSSPSSQGFRTSMRGTSFPCAAESFGAIPYLYIDKKGFSN